jgi:hypothetical protein
MTIIMDRVVFIHGTGVRQESYYRSLDTVGRALKDSRARAEVVPCRWGDDYGAKLLCEGKSIPNYATTRALDGSDTETDERTLWQLLYDDPLFELALLAAAPEPAAAGSAFGTNPAGIELMNMLPGYKPRQAVKANIEEAGVSSLFESALQTISRSRECHDALIAAPDALGPYRMAVARALVAQIITLERPQLGESPLAVNPIARDRLVDAIAQDLGGSDRALAGWILRTVARLGRRTGATNFLERRRGAITDPTWPAVADILLYEARGEKIREFIRDIVEAAGDSVVILAHSLGGVACVDILSEEPIPGVKLLITVGSQAPFFYEVGALPKLPFPDPLRPDFPDWLNIYDPQDLLAYVGRDVFPGRVADEPVDNGLAFPYSHTAYFDNPGTWKIIAPRLG